jgi:hypothetical protein
MGELTPRAPVPQQCEHCRMPIIWAYPVEKRGTKAEAHPRPMPLDAGPSEHGLRTLYAERPSRTHPRGRWRTGELRRGSQATAYRASGGVTYTRHWQTCPKKDQWGKPGKRYGSRDVQK